MHLLLVLSLLGSRALADTSVESVCQAALTPAEAVYFRLLRKAEQDNLISEDALVKMQNGQNLNPLEHLTLSARAMPLQQSLLTYSHRLQPTPRLLHQLKIFAEEVHRSRHRTNEARALTRFVPLPQEDEALGQPSFVEGPTQFFWYRNSRGAPFLAIAQSASGRLRMISLTRTEENLLREPETLRPGQHLLKSSFFLHQDHLKIVYAPPRPSGLVLYDLQTDTRQFQELRGLTLERLEVQGPYLIAIHTKGLIIFRIEPDFAPVAQLDLPLEQVQVLSPTQDRLWIAGFQGRSAFIFEPLQRTEPVCEWHFEHPVLNFVADPDANLALDPPLAAAQVESEGTYLLRPQKGPHLNGEGSKSQRMEWHRTIDGHHVLTMQSPQRLTLYDSDAPTSAGETLLTEKSIHDVQWLRKDQQDFIGLVETLNSGAARVSVLQLESASKTLREVASGTNLSGNGEFLYLDQFGKWLYQAQKAHDFFLSDLQLNHEVVFSRKDVSSHSEPFEIEPGHWLTATLRGGKLSLVHLTRPL